MDVMGANGYNFSLQEQTFEMEFVYQVIRHDGRQKVQTVVEQKFVVMPAWLGKNMLRKLTMLIEQYEKEKGPIKDLEIETPTGIVIPGPGSNLRGRES